VISHNPLNKDIITNIKMIPLIEENPMLMIDSPSNQINTQIDYRPSNDELNRLLCAAVVSKSFRSMLVANPALAASTGYQGETFNLSNEDQNWLSSMRPANLVDFAANLATYQNNAQESRVQLPVEPIRQYVRVN
jgi:hypothetical protein